MCVISFQGVCYFERDRPEGGVTVHLPVGDLDEDHLDGTRAKPHHARVFVRDEVVLRHENFRDCAFYPVDQHHGPLEPVHGKFFPLSQGSRAVGYAIRVSGQGRQPLDLATLKGQLISFGSFSAGLSTRPLPDRVAATLRMVGGEFHYMTSNDDWVIRPLDGTKSSVPLGYPAWRVDWDTRAAVGSPVEISVWERLGDGREIEVGSVTVAGGCTHPGEEAPRIIVGNLDESNPASWPHRKPRGVDGCPRRNGSAVPGCPDEDFKWLFRLFHHDQVIARHRKSKQPALPAPELAGIVGASSKKKKQPSYDTPTCFPGTD